MCKIARNMIYYLAYGLYVYVYKMSASPSQSDLCV